MQGLAFCLWHNLCSTYGMEDTKMEEKNENEMRDTLSKLEMYKTAYCPLHRFYVGIVSVRYDDSGRPIIHARPQDTDKVWMFRMEELTDWVL